MALNIKYYVLIIALCNTQCWAMAQEAAAEELLRQTNLKVQRESGGQTALVMALENNNISNLESLLASAQTQQQINDPINGRENILQRACIKQPHTQNTLNVIKLLLQYGADTNIAISQYQQPLTSILETNEINDFTLGTLEVLLNAGADPTRYTNVTTQETNLAKVESLINAWKQAKYTSMQDATDNPLFKVIKLFLHALLIYEMAHPINTNGDGARATKAVQKYIAYIQQIAQQMKTSALINIVTSTPA
jgi:hypothetical protein